MVAIAAHIPSAEIGSGYFQETHPEHLFKECSSYCELITTPEQMPRVMETAIRRAVAERCVCVIVIPGDVALKPAAPGPVSKRQSLLLAAPTIVPADIAVDALAQILNEAKRVTILCGSGCEGAFDELLALGAALLSPMVHALRGKDFVEANNPFDVGMTGLIGFSSGYKAMEECDTLLMLGTDFPYRQFYPQRARIAQVDIRASALGRRASIDLGVLGDVKETLKRLLPKLNNAKNSDHLNRCLDHYKKARKSLDQLAIGRDGGPVHPQQVAKAASGLADDNAVFTCDVGLATVWAARYIHMKSKRRLLGSFWHGSMANALAQSIGAQAAQPHRQVIAFCGDGGFTMLMGDLLTLKQLKLPVKVIIFNNSSLGFIELEQKSTGIMSSGTRLENPDFAAMAESVGIKGLRITDPKNAEEVMAEALAFPGPVVVDAVVTHLELVVPPKITAEMAKGFTLYMVKAVLSGKADEVVELATTNLWR